MKSERCELCGKGRNDIAAKGRQRFAADGEGLTGKAGASPENEAEGERGGLAGAHGTVADDRVKMPCLLPVPPVQHRPLFRRKRNHCLHDSPPPCMDSALR